MDDVSLLLTDDVAEVDRLASGWIAEHPVGAGVLATILAGELSGARTYPGRGWIIATDARGRVVGALVQTPPHNAWVPAVDPALAELAAQAWHDAGRALPGVTGPLAPGGAFVRRWEALTGVTARQVLREGLHVLDRFEPARDVPGAVRFAGPDDDELVLRWLGEFHAEAMHHAPPPDPAAITRRLADRTYLLWEDAGVPVSLAGRQVAGAVGRVGPVYTPPAHRRRGYAAAVTTAATQHLLDAGVTATLFTDLDNPTSNGVYARLGYRLVDELAEWQFTDA